MFQSTPTKLLLVGLPSSGKTTFLAALWHVLESEEVDEALKLERLGVDRHYLEAIREEWLTFTTPERTKIGEKNLVSMLLRERDRPGNAELVFPDLSGETYLEQWRGRTCTESFALMAQEADGILLFVHTKDRYKAQLIVDVDPTLRQNGYGTVGAITPDPVPNQVKLVEIVQFFLELRQEVSQKLSIAVVLSAWDTIEKLNRILKQTQSPLEFLDIQVPLLSQYFQANPERFRWRVYGLSAQGGDLDADKQQLEKVIKPSERIRLLDGKRTTSDITEPIKWLMGSNGTETA